MWTNGYENKDNLRQPSDQIGAGKETREPVNVMAICKKGFQKSGKWLQQLQTY